MNSLKIERHTIDGDCNRFGELIAVGPDERGNFAERIELEVIWRVVWWFGLHYFEIKTVGFGDGENGSGTNISLCKIADISRVKGRGRNSWGRGGRYRDK